MALSSHIVRYIYLTIALSTFTYSQSSELPSNLPACAQPALLSALASSGCQLSDVHCICSGKYTCLSDDEWIQENTDLSVDQNLLLSVAKACPPADQPELAAFAQTYCGGAAASSMMSAGHTSSAASMASTSSSMATTAQPASTSISTSLTSATSSASPLPTDVMTPSSTGYIFGGLLTASATPANASMTSSMVMTTSASNMTGANCSMPTSTMASSTGQPNSTSATFHGGAAPAHLGWSAAALAVAIGAMTLIFAEL